MEPAPARVAELVAAAQQTVENAVGVRPDLMPETLSLVDHYVRRAEQASGPVVHLAASLVGAYFGELLRHRFGGWWVIEDDDPEHWRLELEPCLLYLYPVGMAVEIIRRAEVAGAEGQFATADEIEPVLRESLADVRVTENDYYSLTGRLEILERVVDWLVAWRKREGRTDIYSRADYAAVLGS